jgi:serine/threonine protein phosphatase PrpC
MGICATKPKKQPAFLKNPITATSSNILLHEQFDVAVASMQGWRSNQEDAFTITSLGDKLCCAIFDGHGSPYVSEYCSEQWLNLLQTQLLQEQLLSTALHKTFFKLDEQMMVLRYLGGSTALCGVFEGHKVTVANAGDSRAILCQHPHEVIPMTTDHKPWLEPELNRIHKAGGFVDCNDRINGTLNCSRGIGDYALKSNRALTLDLQCVSPVPDVQTFDFKPGDFVVMGCDGVFDKVTNEQVAVFVRTGLKEGLSVQTVAEKLLKYCFDQQSTDNMTCVIVVCRE